MPPRNANPALRSGLVDRERTYDDQPDSADRGDHDPGDRGARDPADRAARDAADGGARNPADNAERMLVLHLRTSRRKARVAAAAEVLAALASERTRET